MNSFVADVNTVIDGGIKVYHIDSTHYPSHLPATANHYGTFVSVITRQSYRFGFQIFYDSEDNACIRYVGGPANNVLFGDWHKIQFVS